LEELVAALQAETVARKDFIADFRKLLARAKNDEAEARKKWELAEKEKQDLIARISKVEVERLSLSQKVRPDVFLAMNSAVFAHCQ
jgi:hypothetical protein